MSVHTNDDMMIAPASLKRAAEVVLDARKMHAAINESVVPGSDDEEEAPKEVDWASVTGPLTTDRENAIFTYRAYGKTVGKLQQEKGDPALIEQQRQNWFAWRTFYDDATALRDRVGLHPHDLTLAEYEERAAALHQRLQDLRKATTLFTDEDCYQVARASADHEPSIGDT